MGPVGGIGRSHVPSTLGQVENGNQIDDKEAIVDDFELCDPALDSIKLPAVSFNQ
jgi:hypothetical protein